MKGAEHERKPDQTNEQGVITARDTYEVNLLYQFGESGRDRALYRVTGLSTNPERYLRHLHLEVETGRLNYWKQRAFEDGNVKMDKFQWGIM